MCGSSRSPICFGFTASNTPPTPPESVASYQGSVACGSTASLSTRLSDSDGSCRVPSRMALEVRPVVTRRDLRTFIKLPWRLYRDEPNWVPPLLMDVKKRLDRKKNPFFKHAEVQYFLAWRDGRAVGRISAHIDRNLNQFQDNSWGL